MRQYLAAIQRGNDQAAYAAFGADPGASNVKLSEKDIVDPATRIVKLDAHGTADDATVNVDLATSKGAYFAQYFLRRSPTGAALIYDHVFIKP